MKEHSDLQKPPQPALFGAQAAHTSWREMAIGVPDLPRTCIVCGGAPSRYVGLGAVVAGAEGKPEIDISIAGFCMSDSDQAAGALSDSLLADEDVLSLMGPAVELRAHEVEPFLELMQSLAGR